MIFKFGELLGGYCSFWITAHWVLMEALSRDTHRATCIGCTLRWISEAEINEQIDGESNATGLPKFWCFRRRWNRDCCLVHRALVVLTRDIHTEFLDLHVHFVRPMLVLCRNPVHVVRVCSPSDWAIIFVFEAHSRYKIHLHGPTRSPTVDRQSSGRFIWHPLQIRLSQSRRRLTRELFAAANVVVNLVQYQCFTTFCSPAESSDVWDESGYLRSRIDASRYLGRITRCNVRRSSSSSSSSSACNTFTPQSVII